MNHGCGTFGSTESNGRHHLDIGGKCLYLGNKRPGRIHIGPGKTRRGRNGNVGQSINEYIRNRYYGGPILAFAFHRKRGNDGITRAGVDRILNGFAVGSLGETAFPEENLVGPSFKPNDFFRQGRATPTASARAFGDLCPPKKQLA